MSPKNTQSPFLILGSVLPLIYGFKDLNTSFILSSSVLCAVLLFELVFFAVKNFWLRSIRFSLALIVLSTVIGALWIAAPRFDLQLMTGYFPICLISSVILIQSTIRRTLSFSERVKTWTGFLTWSLLLGAANEWVFTQFQAGLFWLIAAIILFSNLIDRRAYYA